MLSRFCLSGMMRFLALLVATVPGFQPMLRSAQPAPAALLVKKGTYQLKVPRQGAAAVVINDSIYVFGGGSPGGGLSSVERFDVHTHASSVVFDRLLVRRYQSALVYEGKVYLFGGQGYGLPGSPLEYTVEIYDPVTNTVAKGPPMPNPRYNMGAVRYGTKGYLIGGTGIRNNSAGPTNYVGIFDFVTQTWSEGPPMPTSRETRAVVVGDFILVPGGFRDPAKRAEVEMFVPHENVWRKLPDLGRKISAHSLVFFDHYLFTFGDFDDRGLVLAYDLKTRTTQTVAAGFEGSRHTAAVTQGEAIYVFGGNYDARDGISDLVQVFGLNSASRAPAP